MAESCEEVKFCSNCKKDISAVNFVMHEAHCWRHIVLCKHCDEPIPKAELEQHFQDQHEKIPCEKCGQRVEKMHLENHENGCPPLSCAASLRRLAKDTQLAPSSSDMILTPDQPVAALTPITERQSEAAAAPTTDDCPKKPQKCLYCDLEFPKIDLKSHVDYCGSRTEQCPKCSQFILFRDQLQHEETNCAYPVPKTSAENITRNDPFNFLGSSEQSDFHFGLGPAMFGGPARPHRMEGHLNPFVLDEMNRFLNNRPEAGQRTSLLDDDSEFTSTGHPNPTSYLQPVLRRNEISQPKRNNFDTWREPRENSDSNVVDLTSPPSDGNLDYLLALHLAHDLNSSENNHDTVNTFEGDDGWETLTTPTQRLGLTDLSPLPSSTNLSPNITNTAGVEDTEIPCEFCGEPYPADMLVQHQSGCQLRSSPVHSDEDVYVRGRSFPPDINSSRQLAPQPPAQIPIVDNLSYAGPPVMSVDETGISVGLDHEDTMLPCEFCGELLPSDFLVQHQAVCESDSTARLNAVDTTDDASTVLQPKMKNNNIARKVSNIVKSPDVAKERPSRHQEDPNLSTIDFTPVLRAKTSKTVNLNNISGTSNGASRLAKRSSVPMSSKPRTLKDTSVTSQPASSVSRRRQVLSQSENGSHPEAVQISQNRQQQQYVSGIHGDSSEEEGESVEVAAKPKQVSRKAVKQRDNREKQTGGQRVIPGEVRIGRLTRQRDRAEDGASNGLSIQPTVRGLSSRQPANNSSVRQSPISTSSRQAASNSSSRSSVSNTASSQPRRSGNQVFSGPAKRTTPKRRLPDPPS